MVAPFIRILRIEMKVELELILYHLMVNFGDLIFNLDFLNPKNMLVGLV